MSVEEKKNRLKELAGNEQFVSGIYNYCDRWCERCTMRSRCLSFSMDPDLRTEDSSRTDPGNEEFWVGIHESFQLAFELIQESAEKWGIDPDVDLDAELEERERLKQHMVEDCLLGRESMVYADAVSQWMDAHKDRFSDQMKQVERELELPGHDPIPDVLDLHDAVEVVRWYQFFLYPKISRALMGLQDEDRDIMDDVLGSAKIALIALERSIGAWQTLGEQLHLQDETLDMQLRLARIKVELEKNVPEAMAFKRPGFDN